MTDCVSAIEGDYKHVSLGPRALCSYFYSNNLYTIQNSYEQVYCILLLHINADGNSRDTSRELGKRGIFPRLPNYGWARDW